MFGVHGGGGDHIPASSGVVTRAFDSSAIAARVGEELGMGGQGESGNIAVATFSRVADDTLCKLAAFPRRINHAKSPISGPAWLSK